MPEQSTTIPATPARRGKAKNNNFSLGNTLSLLGGRPQNSFGPEKKLKLKQEKVLKTILYRATKKLLHGQMIAAFGTHRIAVSRRDSEGKINYEMVRDEKEIERLLLDGKHGEDYFIVAGADPDWRAADALLSRAYGKPKETLAVEPGAGFSLLALAQMRDGNPDMLNGNSDAKIKELPEHVETHEL